MGLWISRGRTDGSIHCAAVCRVASTAMPGRFILHSPASTAPFADTAQVTAFIEDEVRSAHADRPWVLVNMITSLDGAVSVDGLSGGLGGPADKVVFRSLRGLADVILVGAGTARAENYGPPDADQDTRLRRLARRQAPTPVLALVTRSASLDPTAAMFTEAEQRPLVYVARSTDPARLDALAPVADVVDASSPTGDGVDPAVVMRDLGARGHRVVLAEGGPSLNGDLVAAGVVDELCLTVSPLLVGGDAGRIVKSATASPSRLSLARVLAGDDLLFLRYIR